jgi:hypothetical protein
MLGFVHAEKRRKDLREQSELELQQTHSDVEQNLLLLEKLKRGMIGRFFSSDFVTNLKIRKYCCKRSERRSGKLKRRSTDSWRTSSRKIND